ncbi:MAG TPA: MMPL family transporter [Planctomycetota bacterium]|nr:MMPL family transporter [Planctomycetota bacterium]
MLALHGRLVTGRPRAVALALGVVTAGALLLLPRFRVDPDVAGFLPEEDPAARLLRDTLLGEESMRSMFLVLRGPDLLQRMPALVENLRASPYLADIDAERGAFSDGHVAEVHLAQLPPAILAALEERLAPAGRREAIADSRALLAEDPLAGKTLILNDPLGLRWILEDARRALSPPGLDPHSPYLIWPERELAILRVRGHEDPFDVEFSLALLSDLDLRLADVEWEALGGYDVARRDSARIRSDLTSSLIWSIPLLLVFLTISTRSYVLPHLYLAPVLLAVLWTISYGGLLLGPLTPLAVSGAAILMGLGVDFTIHYLDRYIQERAGADYALAVERTHVGTGLAMLLGMATTVIAFLSMSLGTFPGLVSFGRLLALGLVSAWAVTLCLAPLLARTLGSPRQSPALPIAVRAARRLLATPALLPVAALIVIGGLSGWGLVWAEGLNFDADARYLRPEAERFTGRARSLEEALGSSPLGLRVLVPAEHAPTEIAAGLERLAAGGTIARAVGEVTRVPGPEGSARVARFRERTEGWVEATLADLVVAGFKPELFRAGLVELARKMDAPSPSPEPIEWEGRRYFSLTLYPQRTPEGRAQRAALREATRAALGRDVILADAAGAGDELGPLLARELGRSLGLCGVLMIGMLAVSLRSPRDVLIALAPVTCGLGLALGALILSGFPLHPGNMIALPMVLGLGVDNGVYLVLRWREGDGDPFAATGGSIWRTSVTTIIGFGSLVTATSPAIASLGYIAALGALACFLTSIVVVPALLGMAGGARRLSV